ncbi:hypothetical protein HIM_06325 [Hirsutella minnesotensis 3608]|uniref:CMP/dCMP-type deaminase domain-containing protein n=1 Tax=Hirsutella minnesotensis 3608 TaxID=1043627 RepID=A0A0F8A4X1_9HYPO|nr:hypothetical protein HIM_06325 [Hirsutella minnesotensis 3608]
MGRRRDRLSRRRDKLAGVLRQLALCSGTKNSSGSDDDGENLAARPCTFLPPAQRHASSRTVNRHSDDTTPEKKKRNSRAINDTAKKQQQRKQRGVGEMRAQPDNDMMGGFVGERHSRHSSVNDLASVLGELKIGQNGEVLRPVANQADRSVPEDPKAVKEREQNLLFIGEAIEMARLALRTNETPVGCVLVHKGRIIAKGMNATNVTRNGTRHAELMAISALLSVTSPTGPRTTSLRPKQTNPQPCNGCDASSDSASVDSPPPDEGNEDGRKSHLYPYGQKLHPAERVDPVILRESVLYVTVEPCVMCASLLRQLRIKKVYFGAVNDKFGGTGGVFSIHANSLPVDADGQTASSHPIPRQHPQLPDSSGTLGTSYPPGGGDGGNVEPGFEIEGGWGRDEAVGLLRRFYVQENGRAPVPRKKEGRAARLAAMMDQDGIPSTATPTGETSPIFPPAAEASSETSAEQFKENVAPSSSSDFMSLGSDPLHRGDDQDDYLDVAEKSLYHDRRVSANPVR